jgi:hypothetical protein
MYNSLDSRSTLSSKITRADKVLGHLLHAAGAYPSVAPVPEQRFCGICQAGPFEDLACPECGETDDLPRWPLGARRG